MQVYKTSKKLQYWVIGLWLIIFFFPRTIELVSSLIKAYNGEIGYPQLIGEAVDWSIQVGLIGYIAFRIASVPYRITLRDDQNFEFQTLFKKKIAAPDKITSIAKSLNPTIKAEGLTDSRKRLFKKELVIGHPGEQLFETFCFIGRRRPIKILFCFLDAADVNGLIARAPIGKFQI